MTGLEPYQELRDSGVAWLGMVPAHWGVRRLGSLTRPRTERGRPDLPLLSVVREKGVIPRSSMGADENHNFVPDDLSNYKVTRKGDLVINKMKAWQGSLGLAPMDGIVSPAYYVLQFGMADPKFGQALLRSRPYVNFFAQASDGVRIGQWDLAIDRMKAIPVVVPPPADQSLIVKFIEHVDLRIARYMKAKQRLIRLLDEQRQAIIVHAVTQGLEDGVQTRPSPIEGLGAEIPAHWQARRAKFVFRPVDIRSDDGSETLLTVSSADGVVPRAGRQITMFMAASYVGHKLCWPGDLVINSLWAWARGLGFSQHHGIVSTAYGVYRLRAPYREHYEYLDLLLRSNAYKWQFTVRSKGIWKSRLQLTDDSFLDMPILLPPPSEAAQIVQSIKSRTADVSRSIEVAQRQLDLMREFRVRLIADVVTGQVDVRSAKTELDTELTPPIATDDVETLMDDDLMDDLDEDDAEVALAEVDL
jgi:type I restriction enzyme, S subunit